MVLAEPVSASIRRDWEDEQRRKKLAKFRQVEQDLQPEVPAAGPPTAAVEPVGAAPLLPPSPAAGPTSPRETLRKVEQALQPRQANPTIKEMLTAAPQLKRILGAGQQMMATAETVRAHYAAETLAATPGGPSLGERQTANIPGTREEAVPPATRAGAAPPRRNVLADVAAQAAGAVVPPVASAVASVVKPPLRVAGQVLKTAEEEAFAPLAGRGVMLGEALGFRPGEWEFQKPSLDKLGKVLGMTTDEARDYLRDQPAATQILAEMAIPLLPAEWKNVGQALKMAGRGARLANPEIERIVAEAAPRVREGLVHGEAGMLGKKTAEDLAAEAMEREIRAKYRAGVPTIRDIEARSRPLPPEVRAELRGTPETRMPLSSPDEVATLWGERYQQNWWTKFEDTVGGPFARSPEARAVRRTMVQRDIYVATQGAKMHAAAWDWYARARKTLGMGMNGEARKVTIKAGSDVPVKLAQRLDHILEHPEKYDLTGEMRGLLNEAQDVMTQVLRMEQRQGVDVREILETYWPRITRKTPKGDPLALRSVGGGGRLRTRPSHAKMRLFGDIEDKWRLGYEDASPMEALVTRLQAGVEAIANKRAVKAVKGLGFKPSERYAEDIVQGAKDARQAYKDARAVAVRRGATADEKLAVELAESRLDNSMRALRAERTRWRERQPQIFGSIVSPEVAEEFVRYTDNMSEGAIEQALLLMRANTIWGDLSAGSIQGWYTFYRNNPAWWKAMGYSVRALLRDPVGYVARNADVIARGTDMGAIAPPTEWLLRTGGRAARGFAAIPGVKQTQRAFEWFMFVAQAERWRAVERLAKTPDDMLELAAVLRKQSGLMMMPGLTKAQAKALGRTFFAPQFFAAIHSAPLDMLRGGVAGREAAKSMAMAFGGATALTIGLNYKLNGELPNLTDPDAPGFLSVKVGEGYVYPFGPYQPAIVALFRTGRAVEALTNGEVPMPRDLQAIPRFLEGKFSIPVRLIVAAGEALGIPFSRIRGKAFEPRWLTQYLPIAPTQVVQGVRRNFPAAFFEIVGVRTSPMPTWGGIDLEIQAMNFTDSRGNRIEHYRDLTEPQKIEAEKNTKVQGYLARAEGQDETSRLFAVLEEDRAEGLEWARIQLEQEGPTNEALKKYAADIQQVKGFQGDAFRFLDMAGILEKAGETPNPDLAVRREYSEYISRASGPGGTYDGEMAGQLADEFREIVGEEVWQTILVPQLMADRDPHVQQAQVWSIEVGDTPYYDLVNAKGNADTAARERLRRSDPALDAKLYLLGRTGRVMTAQAAALAQEWFEKWMAGQPITVGTAPRQEPQPALSSR